jgi:hypothetical protein
MTTTEAAVKGRRRLTPDGIYHMATTREGALQLLRGARLPPLRLPAVLVGWCPHGRPHYPAREHQ